MNPDSISSLAASLVAVRWAKTTPEERKAYASKLGVISGKARRKRALKRTTKPLVKFVD